MTLNPGNYFGKLLTAGLEEVGENKTPACYIVFQITHVAADGQWLAIDPVEREARLFLSEKAFDYSADKLRQLGFNGNFDAPAFRPELSEKGLELVCEHELYQGKTQEKWKAACWVGGRDRKPVAKDVARTLAAKFKTAAAANAKPSTPPPAPPTAVGAAASGSLPEQPPFARHIDHGV